MRAPVWFAIAVVLLAGPACSGDNKSKSPTSTVAETVTTDPPGTEPVDPGDIPDDQIFVSFTATSGGFSVKVPEGWARADADGASTFSDKYNSVRIESRSDAAAPTVETARTTEVPAIAASTKRYEKGAVTEVKRRSGPMVRITWKGDGAPNAVTGKVPHLAFERYEIWRNGTTAVLTLSGAVGADNVDPWRTVTDGFKWV